MKNKGIITAVIALVVVAGVAVAMTMNKSSKETTTNTTSSVNTPKPNNNTATKSTVDISSFAFSPANITVKVGTKVTWTNKDSVGHTVTADVASSDVPASQLLATDETYSFTFSKAGTYAYHCKIHTDMKGTVTVTE